MINKIKKVIVWFTVARGVSRWLKTRRQYAAGGGNRHFDQAYLMN